MAYVFENQKVSTVNFTGGGRTLALPGINGSEQDANIIVNGINLLLSLGGQDFLDNHDPREAVRTVKQNVRKSE